MILRTAVPGTGAGLASASHVPRLRPGQLASWARLALRYAVLLCFLVAFAGPLSWMALSALKSSQEIATAPLALPSELHVENLVRAWTIGRFGTYLWNTVLYSVVIVIGVCVASCLAGYALARRRFPGRDVIFVVFLLGLMVPFQSLMIPLYYLARDLGILGTRWAMILPGIALGLPFGIFLMRAFFQDLPEELAQAARIDGCTEFGAFWRVMLPLAFPGLATLVVFEFMSTWNAFLLPLILVQRDELRPVGLGMMFFVGRYTTERGLIAAGVILTSLPIVVLYLALQRQFIRGITAGALK